MPDDKAPVNLPQNKVVINGAEYNLLASLMAEVVKDVKADLRATEGRVTAALHDRFEQHDKVHGEISVRMAGYKVTIEDRLGTLEKAETGEAIAAAFASGRKSFLVSAVEFVRLNRTVILTVLAVLGGWLAGTLGHVFDVLHP